MWFLVLLMAAVPARGAIGAAMILCGPGHGAPPTTDSGSPGSHEPTPASHHHAPSFDSVGHHDHDKPGLAHGHGESGGAASQGAFTCSLCADCCAGGSILLPAALSIPTLDRVDTAFPPVLISFERRPPDGLERPPHTSLA